MNRKQRLWAPHKRCPLPLSLLFLISPLLAQTANTIFQASPIKAAQGGIVTA